MQVPGLMPSSEAHPASGSRVCPDDGPEDWQGRADCDWLRRTAHRRRGTDPPAQGRRGGPHDDAGPPSHRGRPRRDPRVVGPPLPVQAAPRGRDRARRSAGGSSLRPHRQGVELGQTRHLGADRAAPPRRRCGHRRPRHAAGRARPPGPPACSGCAAGTAGQVRGPAAVHRRLPQRPAPRVPTPGTRR